MGRTMNVLEEHENRVATITAIAIEAKALTVDENGDKTSSTDDPNVEKILYARAFQAWADGRIEGAAEDVFEKVQEVMDV